MFDGQPSYFDVFGIVLSWLWCELNCLHCELIKGLGQKTYAFWGEISRVDFQLWLGEIRELEWEFKKSKIMIKLKRQIIFKQLWKQMQRAILLSYATAWNLGNRSRSWEKRKGNYLEICKPEILNQSINATTTILKRKSDNLGVSSGNAPRPSERKCCCRSLWECNPMASW